VQQRPSFSRLAYKGFHVHATSDAHADVSASDACSGDGDAHSHRALTDGNNTDLRSCPE
jgi:hypothetical protein